MKNWKWDSVHVLILVGYVFGAFEGAEPLIAAMVTGHNPNSQQVLFGVGMLLVSAMGGFFKAAPNSLEAAVDAGKAAVTLTPGVTLAELPKRAAKLVFEDRASAVTPIDPPTKR